MQNTAQSLSVGLAFMEAAANAIPKTLGDRERISALSEAMALAVKNRFVFDRNDAARLNRLSIHRCVGVFRPLDYYAQACRSGGTYTRMWEAHQNRKPWVATRAVFTQFSSMGPRPTFLEKNRVAVGAGVILPATFSPYEEGLATFQGHQVWWCTSMDDDAVTLCRYFVWDAANERPHSSEPFHRVGRPARIRKVSRKEWAEWNELMSRILTPAVAA